MSDGVTLSLNDKVTEADQDDGKRTIWQSICGAINSWTGRFVRGFVKSRNAVFENRIYIDYLRQFSITLFVNIFPFPIWARKL